MAQRRVKGEGRVGICDWLVAGLSERFKGGGDLIVKKKIKKIKKLKDKYIMVWWATESALRRQSSQAISL